MANPSLTLLYNSTGNDIIYAGSGESDGTFYPVISGSYAGTLVFTGGGIDNVYDGDANGTRSATIRPAQPPPGDGYTIIPKTFIEYNAVSSGVLHQVPLAGPDDNRRYPFAVHVSGGNTTSEVYLEAWDTMYHTTCSSTVLSGTNYNGNASMIRAITTTNDYPGTTWSGTPLRGYESRIGLSDLSAVTDGTTLYFNIYIKIPYDCDTFVNMPILSLRYLYS
jgi:hypothetical protein